MGTPYGSQIENFASNLNALRRRYLGGATAAAGTGASLMPRQQNSMNALARLYQQPELPGARAGFINQRVQPINAAYDAANANLTARAAREGDNSFLAGQRAILQGQRANAYGNATNEAADMFDQRHQANLESLYGLFTGAGQQAQEQERYNLGQSNAANSDLLQLYLSLSNAEKQRAAAAQANKLGALGQLIGTGAQLYGMGAFGGGGGGGPAPLDRTLKIYPGQYAIRG